MTPFGFLNCDKPIGMTSRDLVNIVAKRFRETRDPSEPKIKLGHAGTLDPLAEGVLVIGIGRAVRLIPYVQQQAKSYRATFLLGQTSDSGDLEDEVVSYPDLPVPTMADLQTAAESMTGTITQVPPAHSAIRVDGRRAYERVRAGETVDMPSREVEIYDFHITRFAYPEVDMDIVCGSGTYIRTLGMDLAKAVGTVGVMKHLRRHGIGVFGEDTAINVEQIRSVNPRDHVVPARLGARALPTLVVEDGDAIRLLHGLEIIGEATDREGNQVVDGEVAVIWQDELVAIVKRRGEAWGPFRVFPRSEQFPSKADRAPSKLDRPPQDA